MTFAPEVLSSRMVGHSRSPRHSPLAGRAPRLRVAHAFELLLRQHRSATGDEAWIRGGARGKLELARDAGDSWVIPPSVRPHAYRMSDDRIKRRGQSYCPATASTQYGGGNIKPLTERRSVCSEVQS